MKTVPEFSGARATGQLAGLLPPSLKWTGTRAAVLLVFAAACGANAQLQLSSADLAAIEATTPLSSDGMPPIGTFYSAADPNLPPAPGNFFELSGWSLGNGYYLLNDVDGNGSGGGFHTMDDSGPAFPGGGTGGSGDDVTNYFSYIPPTNGLWLQITNVSNGSVYANLNGATDAVYEIYSTTNLALAAMSVSNWDIETEIFPGSNTNSMPFVVPINDRSPLFLWARDWTGITSGGNTTPEWWFWEYFGTVDLSDNDLDSQGYTLLHDYTNGFDPNVIQFSVSATNQYVNTALVPLQLEIQAGIPNNIAVVDSANFIPGGETWYSYASSNIIVNLDSTEGEHDIWIGLKGIPTNATVTWQEITLTLQTNAPVIAVTNPVSATVPDPIIQVQGIASERLASLTYDVSNATGSLTNQSGYIIGEQIDPNSGVYTEDYFHLYDVRLAGGPNTITIHATDLFGNMSATNITCTFDASSQTNPPALSIVWPQTGTLISAGSFTLHAQVDDPLDGVTAVITDSNGDTNVVAGTVQRNGNVWVNGLPMAPGTNILTVTATNFAGISVTTNLTLVQSAVTVTMDPLSQLNQSSVTVTGTISDTNDNLTVNGVQATVGNGAWSASDVPVSSTGMATFDLELYTGDPSDIGSQTVPVLQPPVVGLSQFVSYWHNWWNWHYTDTGQGTNLVTQDCWQPANQTNLDFWTLGQGGEYFNAYWANPSGSCTNQPTFLNGTNYGFTPSQNPPWENYDYEESYTDDEGEPETKKYHQQTTLTLSTGGEGSVGTTQLYLITAEATDEYYPPYLGIPPEYFTIGGKALADTGIPGDFGVDWGCVLLQLPAGITNYNIPVQCADPDYVFAVEVTNITLQIVDNNNSGNTLSGGQTNTVIVGQQMNLSCQLNVTNAALMNSMLANIQWTVPRFAISNYVVAPDTSSAYVATNFPTSNTNVVFYWVDGAYSRVVQCSATINGATIRGQVVFNVVVPKAPIITVTSSVTLGTAIGGAFSGICFGTNGGPPGILFSPVITMPQGNYNYGSTAYTSQWVQVIEPPSERSATFLQGTNTVTETQANTNVVLDTSYPYGYNTLPYPATSDYPCIQTDLTNELAASDTQYSQMWLMFQPTNGNWVPLKTVSWYFSASATNSGTNWIFVGPPSWSTNPPDADPRGQFPVWNGNSTNLPVTVN